MIVRRILACCVFSLISAGLAQAQSINLLSSTEEAKNEENNLAAGQAPPVQMAVPLGATAGIGSDSENDADVGAVLGFQLWQKDRSLLATFFSFSGSQTIDGTQGGFGAFLLNPSTSGSSFYLTGNRLWSFKNGRILYGPSGRIGVTGTTWRTTTSTGDQSTDGFVAYVAPTFLLASKTFATDSAENEYQFGVEVGPSLRVLGGDLGQSDAFLSDSAVLGSADDSYLGWEATFFARLNSAQPFIRISHFDSDASIPGFSGTQAIIGVNVLSSVFKSQIE